MAMQPTMREHRNKFWKIEEKMVVMADREVGRAKSIEILIAIFTRTDEFCMIGR
jgi:hypothetical protein